jgi:hypothetical protein
MCFLLKKAYLFHVNALEAEQQKNKRSEFSMN